MLFSIIVPVYKVEDYIEKCIDSILLQSYTDFELILIDDGSPDKCPLICDQYKERDSRVKVIHKQNGGLSSARNAGLKVAKGEYILFLDSDDFFISGNVLEYISKKTCKNPDIILYKTAISDEKGIQISYPNMDFSFVNKNYSYETMLQLTVKGEEFQASAWSKAIRRDVLLANKIKFTEGLLGEDIDWYLSVIRNCYTYEAIDEYVYVYRQRKGSITHSFGIKNLSDLLWILEKWSPIILNNRCGSKVDEALSHYLGKTYTSLLIVYASVGKARKQYKNDVKKLSYLLNYDGYKRTHIIRMFYRIFGFSITIFVLQILRKICS